MLSVMGAGRGREVGLMRLGRGRRETEKAKERLAAIFCTDAEDSDEFG